MVTMSKRKPARPRDWCIREWECIPDLNSNKPYYWEVAYCLPELEDDEDYGISFTLYCETSGDAENTQHGCWVWTGASLAEIVDQFTKSLSGASDDLAAQEFDQLPNKEVIRSVPSLDERHTALLFSWFHLASLRVLIGLCQELQRREVALEPHHEAMLIESVFENRSPVREAVEMIASLRRAEGLD